MTNCHQTDGGETDVDAAAAAITKETARSLTLFPINSAMGDHAAVES